MSKNLRVHIAPVGFEFRRVTEPLIEMQADKVYLITYEPNDAAQQFLFQIKKELGQKYKHIEVKEIYVDLWNLYDCVECFHGIIQEETGNHVYVNVSTGTKITAISGMLSCMIWGAHPYYAKVSYVHLKELAEKPTESVGETIVLPVCDINKPRSETLLILNILKENGGQLRKVELIRRLESLGIIKLRDEMKEEFTLSAKHSQLRAILDPMEIDWGYVHVEARGRRSIVFLTEQGENALRLFGVNN